MRKPTMSAALALLMTAAASVAAADYEWPVVRVIDGDTVQVDASADMPPALASIRVRLHDVDTPETWRPKCESERRAGEAATAFTKRAIAGANRVTVRPYRWDRFGRVVANLMLDGRTLSSMLIEAGLGRPWTGREEEWCR